MGNGGSLESFSEIWYPWPLDRTPVSLVHAKDGVLGLPTTVNWYGTAQLRFCALRARHLSHHSIRSSIDCIIAHTVLGGEQAAVVLRA